MTVGVISPFKKTEWFRIASTVNGHRLVYLSIYTEYLIMCQVRELLWNLRLPDQVSSHSCCNNWCQNHYQLGWLHPHARSNEYFRGWTIPVLLPNHSIGRILLKRHTMTIFSNLLLSDATMMIECTSHKLIHFRGVYMERQVYTSVKL